MTKDDIMPKTEESQSQSDKFKKLARELETNEDEAAFDRALKKVAKAKPEVKKPAS
jgi:hypothetical protein